MIYISFELTMPNRASWNGKWTNDGKKLWVVRKFKQKDEIVSSFDKPRSFYYNFGDGWGANVSTETVDRKTAKYRIKNSAGFSSYEWMVDEILKHGRILTREERNK